MRTTTASWCQPRKSPCCRKILSAVSCQPVILPVLKEIYPWSISCCAHCQRVRHWGAISCIRTSVRRRSGSKALSQALHDKGESFFINSEANPYLCSLMSSTLICVLLFLEPSLVFSYFFNPYLCSPISSTLYRYAPFLYIGECSFRSQVTFANKSYISSP